jgi:hypothetical protein
MVRFFLMLVLGFFLVRVSAQPAEKKSPCYPGPEKYVSALPFEKTRADSIMSQNTDRLSFLSNYDSLTISGLDKILTYDHQVYIVKIQNITPSLVLFLYPFNTEVHSLNRINISQIQYADGRIDIFLPLANKQGFNKSVVDTARIIIRNRREWEKVTLTENAADITGMIEMGKISVSYEADIANAASEYLEKNAGIILRRKAANLNAPIVLLVNKTYHKGYGDLPSIEMEVIIYNYE